jgi:formate dehydrogenase major subunit
LCGQLWRDHLHHWRQGQERDSAGLHVEGDPDHPINRGTLCPKGSSLEQDILNDRRLLKPQVRRPGATDWEDISWDQAYSEIAQR